MKKRVKWGIIGAGGIAKRRTLPVMESVDNAEIVSIMDVNVEELINLSKKFRIPEVYTNEDDLLRNSDIDAVYVATPVSFHKEQATKVLEAGKHLLLEKPLGIDKKESKKILEISRKYDVKSGAAMVMRFHDGHQKMRRLVENGKLGKIVSARAQLSCWFPEIEGNWRQKKATSGGGSLMDMGIHCIDLLSYILDDKVDRAGGIIENRIFNYEVEDSASALIQMRKGPVCYIDAHFNIPDKASKNILEIYGTKGSIIANGTIGQDSGGKINVAISDQSAGYDSNQNRLEEESSIQMEFEKTDIYAKQIHSFSDYILNNTGQIVSFEDAFDTMKVIDTIYTSSKLNRLLKVQ